MADEPDLPKTQGKKVHPLQQERAPKFSDYLRVFSYATKWDVCVYVIGSLASIGAGIMMPLMNIIFGKLVGQFTASSTVDDFQKLVNKEASYIVGLFFGRWFLSSINKFCFRVIGLRLSAAIRLHYLNSLLSQSIQVIDSMPLGAPATAITATTNTLQIGVSERLGTMLQSISTVCAAIIVSFIWSWNITLVTSSLLLYVLVILSVLTPRILKGMNAMTKADGEGIALASEAIEGIRLVAACGAQSLVAFRYKDRVQEARRRVQDTAPLIGLQLGLIVRTNNCPLFC
jgi:ATP-binding cassette, subfamily B (MDR/TAP), member 1